MAFWIISKQNLLTGGCNLGAKFLSLLTPTDEKIIVDGNLSIPKTPKVTYVNFDAATLAMDDVGERPWDRAFFRDMALALIERGMSSACL